MLRDNPCSGSVVYKQVLLLSNLYGNPKNKNNLFSNPYNNLIVYRVTLVNNLYRVVPMPQTLFRSSVETHQGLPALAGVGAGFSSDLEHFFRKFSTNRHGQGWVGGDHSRVEFKLMTSHASTQKTGKTHCTSHQRLFCLEAATAIWLPYWAKRGEPLSQPSGGGGSLGNQLYDSANRLLFEVCTRDDYFASSFPQRVRPRPQTPNPKP